MSVCDIHLSLVVNGISDLLNAMIEYSTNSTARTTTDGVSSVRFSICVHDAVASIESRIC